jgi:hypothetical protein
MLWWRCRLMNGATARRSTSLCARRGLFHHDHYIFYVALPFLRADDGGTVPGEAIECPNAATAILQAKSCRKLRATSALLAARSGRPIAPGPRGIARAAARWTRGWMAGLLNSA